MNVRKATLDDLELLTLLYKKDGRKRLTPIMKYPLIDWIMKGPHLILIGEEEEPVGFMIIRIKGEESSIDVLSVARRYRGKIEYHFIKDALEFVSTEKIFVTVPSNASRLIETYKSLGFVVYDNVPDAFGKGRHGLKLLKRLQDTPKESRVIGGGVYKKPGDGYLEINLKNLDMVD